MGIYFFHGKIAIVYAYLMSKIKYTSNIGINRWKTMLFCIKNTKIITIIVYYLKNSYN